jgi:uncharacterized protein (DUF488 family)
MRTIYTIGHSTHPIDEFIGILRAYEIDQLVDVRTVPGSRHNPQFGKAELERSMPEAGIRYVHMPELGGLRKATKDSVNTAWRNASFRNFADYMQTQPFSEGVDKLVAMSKEAKTVIMCAEAVPWRCHRSLVADALLVRGAEVVDIMSEKSSKPHEMTAFAKVDGLTITYPGP